MYIYIFFRVRSFDWALKNEVRSFSEERNLRRLNKQFRSLLPKLQTNLTRVKGFFFIMTKKLAINVLNSDENSLAFTIGSGCVSAASIPSSRHSKAHT